MSSNWFRHIWTFGVLPNRTRMVLFTFATFCLCPLLLFKRYRLTLSLLYPLTFCCFLPLSDSETSPDFWIRWSCLLPGSYVYLFAHWFFNMYVHTFLGRRIDFFAAPEIRSAFSRVLWSCSILTTSDALWAVLIVQNWMKQTRLFSHIIYFRSFCRKSDRFDCACEKFQKYVKTIWVFYLFIIV